VVWSGRVSGELAALQIRQNIYEQNNPDRINMRSKHQIIIILIVSMIISGCVDQVPQEPVQPEKPTIETEQIDLSDTTAEKMDFARYYSLDPLNITLNTAQYDLPLQTDQISNYDSFSKAIPLSDDAVGLLRKNGFVVIDNLFYQKEGR
jgi:hypothetical protein